MATSKRRRITKDDDSDDSASASEEESNSDNNSQELVNVDFEAYAADDGDFHGIKQLLLQLFLKASIDITALTNFLIKQNHITCVIKNSNDPEDDDDSSDDTNFCFGFASIVNITYNEDVECIRQLKNYLGAKCQSVCSPPDFSYFFELIEDEEKHVGLIFNERLINIPSQITLPIMESLRGDMESTDLHKAEKMFDFTHYLLICKIHCNCPNNFMDDESPTMYVHAEDECFAEESNFRFNFLMGDKETNGEGRWKEDDVEWQSGRQILLLPANKLEAVLTRLKAKFST